MSGARITYTPAEYLRLERAAETRNGYLNGQMLVMASGSRAHNLIKGNLAFQLHRQLRDGQCETFISTMRVRVSRTGLYTYPDIAVACGDIQFEDDQVDTLLNPVVVIEVLSPKTDAYDRGEKFAHYRRRDSLQEYVLVSQDKVRVERYARQGDQWVLAELSALEDVLHVDAIWCSVRLSDIYERVELPRDSSPVVIGGDHGAAGGPSGRG